MLDASVLRHFKTTETLFTLSPLPARKGLPAGWFLRMPIGLQHVSVELHTLRPGLLGAYRIRMSRSLPVDEWEAAAVDALGDLAAFAVIELSDIMESQAELLASAFHMVWAGGELNTLVPELRRLYIITEDQAALRWVTPKGMTR
ncbi:hypothetical protein [Agrobacterium fabrum]|uniref:hypothetical protein n=1 Tax=Agrobacterium fabrum TaxID=1176649 RepID=UPI003B9F702F